ncbi:MAG TPA: carboxypeptidase-like regulatory domain-containing protein, partial [Terriglobia bacterium]|nr:carboxypeptidase-like regulatory domain-containing protein [Terriglobia bacterium]
MGVLMLSYYSRIEGGLEMFGILRGKTCKGLLSIGMLMAIVGSCFAQSPATGTLKGIVTDSTNARIADVEVTILDSATGFTKTVKTDSSGQWTINEVPSGTYYVTLNREGFAQAALEGIVVPVTTSEPLMTTLEVAGIKSTADVFADAEQLHLETAEVGKSAFAHDLVNLTSSTRSFTGVMTGMAGVSTDISKSLVNTNGNQSPSVNGARTTSTSLQFNGIDSTNLSSGTGSMDDNIAPAVDFLREVRVQTSMYDAAVGRSGGGNVMLFTQSGTDKYHGSAYWFGQNEVLNANEYFLNSEGIKRPIGRRNEGGFTLGGPVPVSGWKDKIKFFGGYQKTSADTAYVPTARSLTQIPTFLGLIKGARTEQSVRDAIVTESVQEGNPTFAQQWLANAIYSEVPVSPIALQILNLRNPVTGDYWIPSPRTTDLTSRCNNPYGTYIRGLCDDGTISNKGQEGVPVNSSLVQGQNGNFRLPFAQERIISPATFDQGQYTARVDYQMTPTSFLAANYFFADFPTVDPFTDPNSQASPVSVKRLNRGRVASVTYQKLIGSAFMNEARVGMFALRNTRQLDDPFLDPMYTNAYAGINNPATFFDNGPGANRLGRFYFTNNISHLSFGASNDAYNKRELNSYSLADNASWITGAHHFKFGGEFKLHYYNTNLPEQQGTDFKFDSMFQFVIGKATEATTRFGVTDKHFTMRDVGYYLADDWKVTSNLTLNLGVRWDLFGSPEERDGRIANFDMEKLKDPNNPLSAIVVASNATDTGFAAIDQSLAVTARASTKSTLRGQDLNNFAPRFGFAYAPLGQQKFVIRGGYGFFYDRPSAAFINTIYKNYPFMHQIKVAGPHGMVPV